MKKLLIALTALVLATPALASQPLPFDTTSIYDDGTGESGCTPVMSFKQGAVYTVNYKQRFIEMYPHSENPEADFESVYQQNGIQFIVKPAHRTSVKFNGKFPKSAGLPDDENAYFANPEKGDNKIEIVKPFKGTICFTPAG